VKVFLFDAMDADQGPCAVSVSSLQGYRNLAMARPDEHCGRDLSLVLTEGRWDWRDKLDRAQALDLQDLTAFHKQVRAPDNPPKDRTGGPLWRRASRALPLFGSRLDLLPRDGDGSSSVC
jgi:hypothetical protein